MSSGEKVRIFLSPSIFQENSAYSLLLENGDAGEGSPRLSGFVLKSRGGGRFSLALAEGLVETICLFLPGTDTQSFVSFHECTEDPGFPDLSVQARPW